MGMRLQQRKDLGIYPCARIILSQRSSIDYSLSASWRKAANTRALESQMYPHITVVLDEVIASSETGVISPRHSKKSLRQNILEHYEVSNFWVMAGKNSPEKLGR